jgi:hypothetical protein
MACGGGVMATQRHFIRTPIEADVIVAACGCCGLRLGANRIVAGPLVWLRTLRWSYVETKETMRMHGG